MKKVQRNLGILGLCSLVLASALLSGCASSTPWTSRKVAAASGIPAAPPPGKTLVCIHCPKTSLYVKLDTRIWDGTNFVASLGNGFSTAYVCEPGEHYFLNLSVEISACVEASLLPDQTYDLWVDTYRGMFVTSYKIKPLKQDDKTRRRVAKWSEQNRWVERASAAADYEQDKQATVLNLLEEFTAGDRKDKLQHLAPEDHR